MKLILTVLSLLAVQRALPDLYLVLYSGPGNIATPSSLEPKDVFSSSALFFSVVILRPESSFSDNCYKKIGLSEIHIPSSDYGQGPADFKEKKFEGGVNIQVWGDETQKGAAHLLTFIGVHHHNDRRNAVNCWPNNGRRVPNRDPANGSFL